VKRLTCKGCDTQFVALRSDAVTCSAKCRKRYQRMCDHINREMQKQEAVARAVAVYKGFKPEKK
jgi:hypothetical protein